MIAHLRGIISKGPVGEMTIDVSGVGYKVQVPTAVWDEVAENTPTLVHIFTYVREDRLDLYGFLDAHTKTLFETLIGLSGIGPKLGLELCSAPRALLLQAVNDNDASLLSQIKGIGKKTAEKLLLELKSLMEKHPHIFVTAGSTETLRAEYDQDVIAALTQLGFSVQEVHRILPTLPKELVTTEERVTAALRSL